MALLATTSSYALASQTFSLELIISVNLTKLHCARNPVEGIMATFNATVFAPLSGGTPVYDVSGGGHQYKGLSIEWSTKANATSVGCPQWMSVINVAESLQAAQQATPLKPDLLASSSASSRNVTYQQLGPDGKVQQSKQVPYVLVPVSHYELDSDGNPETDDDGDVYPPIADEIWFSFDAQPTGLVAALMNALEGVCKSQPSRVAETDSN
jgi:hypothetical protein